MLFAHLKRTLRLTACDYEDRTERETSSTRSAAQNLRKLAKLIRHSKR